MTKIGEFKGQKIVDVDPHLRKINQVRTIYSTCAIEGNMLSENEVTALIENKRVVAPKRQIKEIRNALTMYAEKSHLKYDQEKDLLFAHKILMQGLLDKPGEYRNAKVAVVKDNEIVHLAPPPARVGRLMQDLFLWVQGDQDTHLLIKSAVFHFEYELIHPFEDGNGRIGRFWQHLMLVALHPIFRSVPVENIVHQNQQEYYAALKAGQKEGEATPFLEFSLFTILKALELVDDEMGKGSRVTVEQRLQSFVEANPTRGMFSRKDYIQFFGSISPVVASRDLAEGVKKGIFQKSGDKNTTKYKIAK
ncbi:MAG: Fic family protein [Deltaproteobacteria bacterium]|nr:Fic family protein [Deltaproteobacteria bacterium]